MRAIVILLLIAAAPAWAGSQVLLIYDPAMAKLQRIVIPDDDKELSDPAYAPKGTAQMKISVQTFKATPTIAGLEALLPKPVVGTPAPAAP